MCTLCFGPIGKCAHIIVYLATSVQRFFDDHKKCVHTCFTECSFFLLATQVCTLFLLLAPQNSGSRVRACARAGVHTCSLLADWHSRTASTAGCPPRPRPWVGVLEGWATPPGRSSGLGGRGIAERERRSWPMALPLQGLDHRHDLPSWPAWAHRDGNQRVNPGGKAVQMGGGVVSLRSSRLVQRARARCGTGRGRNSTADVGLARRACGELAARADGGAGGVRGERETARTAAWSSGAGDSCGAQAL